MRHAPDFGEQTYRGSGRLEGRRAVITGGDSGIGRAVALAFAREGADVLISHLEEEERDAQETLRVVRDARRTGVSMPGDLRDEGYCRPLIEHAARELRGVDILVTNAAYQMARGGIAEISAEELDRKFRTNIFAMFHTCRAPLEHMQAVAQQPRLDPGLGAVLGVALVAARLGESESDAADGRQVGEELCRLERRLVSVVRRRAGRRAARWRRGAAALAPEARATLTPDADAGPAPDDACHSSGASVSRSRASRPLAGEASTPLLRVVHARSSAEPLGGSSETLGAH